MSQSFSARFDCLDRTYHYYFPRGKLNLDQMRTASQLLIGDHDFRNFCKMDVGNGVVKFQRKILSVKIEDIDQNADAYSMHRLTLVGQAFLWHQVRCILAVLFLIGEGKEQPSVISELFDVIQNPRQVTIEITQRTCIYNSSVYISV